MTSVPTCPTCRRAVPPSARYCPDCGKQIEQESTETSRSKEILNLRILYGMVGLLILAVLFPPWESPPDTPPAYLGMHFLLNPPEPGAVVSGLLQTVELATVAIGGLYLAWVFRDKP